MSIIRFDEFQDFNKELIAMQQQQALQRFIERSSQRERTVENLNNKNPTEIDTPERIAIRKKFINPRDGLAFERVFGENDLFPISYFEAGLIAAKPVCRIEVRDRIGRILGHGTGFLVSSKLLLTNNHVLENEDSALFSVAQFNYEMDLDQKERPIKSFRFKPNTLFITDQKLDFTLVAIEEVSADGTKSSDFGFLPLLPQKGKVLLGEYVSIIQHPSGAPKAIALRNNKITDIFDDYIHYLTDTQPGSSGSPVFNDQWIVVGLHHAGVPDPNDNTKYISNEGIRISSILKFAMESNLSDEKKALIDGIVNNRESIDTKAEEWQEFSTGYDTKFLGDNNEVPHPKFRSDLKQDIVTQRNDDTVLNYTHFSIVMSKSRRLSYYTVVNIDGNKLVNIGRENKWNFDPRIEEKYQCGPELYDNNDIDKGHLVRRRDPVWGDNANEANKDTFHYTNSSPQHKDLNQKTWLELEDYILENADKFNLKVTVFTGPVFRGDDIIYRNVQIPAEFWKVAVMVKENGELSATAYLQTQKNLIDNLEFAYGEFKTYQIKVSTIENLTGLDFGNLRNHDPIERIETTAVGRVINNSKDILF
ncbi:DNA/RNA non-specific endonuclease [Bacillus sp. ISL-4]|uniref:DNA/RNA non-specific endonuclease n=1 Tax=Bacillus sp. ISL-4 TaxID=2819125 RepID=UPI001BECB135|nr:DNA/RNA non-specific endonuclease [Bacillus sp. ISL-4]MBT2667295.1 DNA/RNA non-specific endonuclease [Bacillus sp. ISL-4]MBT2670601.1 DNA/RNA non-specific endonuclease [Streptomyces sp. ISL-14]